MESKNCPQSNGRKQAYSQPNFCFGGGGGTIQLEKLKNLQSDNKFPAFYKHQRLTAVATNFPSNFVKIHFNTNLPSMHFTCTEATMIQVHNVALHLQLKQTSGKMADIGKICSGFVVLTVVDIKIRDVMTHSLVSKFWWNLYIRLHDVISQNIIISTEIQFSK
jgi:hypothetical protein